VERWEKEEGMETFPQKQKQKQFNAGFSGKWRKWIPHSWPQQNNDNVSKEPSDTHIKTLKEEILEDTTEKFMETILDMVN
jgi:hypothetical protein